MKTFENIDTKEINSIIDTVLTENMTFGEVVDELERTENKYFYISLCNNDILEAIENEKEIAEQLELWLVCIQPIGIYVALHH